MVPVISPLGSTEPASAVEVVDRADEPWGRFVTVTLARSLDALETALSEVKASRELTPFATAVSKGVSANLCAAVSGLVETATAQLVLPGAQSSGLGIDFSWSIARPLSAEVKSAFLVQADDSSILTDASEFLKRLTPRPRVQVIGHVVRLERMEEEAEGTVGIRGVVEDTERTVAVTLSPADYARAIHAHESGAAVSCSGVLERRGNHFSLADPTDFEVLPSLF